MRHDLQPTESYGSAFLTRQQHLPYRVTPLNGWFLDRIVALDITCPGLAGHVFRASPERRHVIAAYLSSSSPCSDFRSEAETGWFLTNASHDCILRAGFGGVPPGYRGALGRTVENIQDRRFYRFLHRLLFNRGEGPLIKLIHRIHDIDLMRLRIARALPLDLLDERLVTHLLCRVQAADVVRVVALLEALGVDRAALTQALGGVTTTGEIARTLRRWALKAYLPPHPVPAGNGYHPITTGEELSRTALRYRNCMRSYLASVLEGEAAFAIVRGGTEEAIAHLVCSGGVWQLDRLHGTMIAPVSLRLRATVESHLAGHNICSRRNSTRTRMYDPLRRLIGGYDPDNEA